MNHMMKRMKWMSLAMALVTLSLNSCKDDKKEDVLPAKPTVTITEVGHGNNLKAHPGHDLHLEATIDAPGLVKTIAVEIHQESGGTYEIDTLFSEGSMIGVRNVNFHKHIDIPAAAPLGAYHLHFTVTDQAGQQTVAESELTLVESDGTEEEEHDHAH